MGEDAMRWSAYQQAIFDEVRDGEGHLCVESLAGSGKTTTAVELINHLPSDQTILFTAFNKAIATELASRITAKNCEVLTTHSLGLRTVGQAWGRDTRVDDKGLRLRKHVEGLLGTRDQKGTADDYLRQVIADAALRERLGEIRDVVALCTYETRAAMSQLVGMCKNTLSHDLDAIIDVIYRLGIPVYPYSDVQFAYLAMEIMDRMSRPDGLVDFDDMIWLPARLNLRTPGRWDNVVVDEAQDLCAAQLWLVQRALKPNGRMIVIGDRRQCHPPGTKVSARHINSREVHAYPIEELDPKTHRILAWNRHAQRSVGFRKFKIAAREYRGHLREITVRVGANAGVRFVKTTPNHKFLARWANRRTRVCVTYLMWRSGFGFRVGWCQLFAKTGALHLSQRARIEKADAVWVLRVHESRTDASAYESIIAAKYGIPTVTFEPVHGATHLTANTIRTIFNAVAGETGERGMRCLTDHDRDFEIPFYPWPIDEGYSRRGRMTYFLVHAANILPGLMLLPLPDNRNAWGQVAYVGVERYGGLVYSLDVDEDHMYAADGIVTHNSIYAFRGADPTAIPRMTEVLKAKVLPLSISYRCPVRVVGYAKKLVPALEAAPGAKDGVVNEVTVNTMLERAQAGDVILSRTNAPLAKHCLALLRVGQRARIVGKDIGAGLVALVKRSRMARLADFLGWLTKWEKGELEKLEASGRNGSMAAAIMDRAETLRVLSEGLDTSAELIARVESLFADKLGAGHVLLSSTHKAKGLEWDRVWLLRSTYLQWAGIEEENLLYVAATRSKESLFIVLDTMERCPTCEGPMRVRVSKKGKEFLACLDLNCGGDHGR